MKLYMFILGICVILSAPVSAQLTSDQPRCFQIRNDSGYRAFGHVETARFGDSYHRHNFSLKDRETWDVCSRGPFFPDYTLDVVLKSLFPIDRCRTGQGGVIRIISAPNPDTGRDVLSLDCSKNVM